MPRKSRKSHTYNNAENENKTLLGKINAIETMLNINFAGRQREIEAILLALITKQNAILVAPSGTAKTSIIKMLSSLSNLRYWRHTFSAFDEKSDILGALDPIAYEKGKLKYIYTNLINSHIAHLDELFRASGVVRDLLLEILEERTVDGKKTSLITALGTANFLTDEPEDQAVLDRFSIRVFSNYLPIYKLDELLKIGLLNIQNEKFRKIVIQPKEIDSFLTQVIKQARQNINKVLEPLRKFYTYLEFQHKIIVSDRRKIRIFLLGQAYAIWRGTSIHHALTKIFELSIPKEPDEIELVRDATFSVEFFPKAKQIKELMTMENEIDNYFEELNNADTLTKAELTNLLAKVITSTEKIINKLEDYKDPDLQPHIEQIKEKIENLFKKIKELKEELK